MRRFDHIGLPTEEPQPNEKWVDDTRVWVTNPLVHPYQVEYLRYEPDTPVTGPVRSMPHVAFQVDDLEEELEGAEILLGPFNPTPTLRVVFVMQDGAVWEFMENSGEGHWFEG